jgi:bacterioferritin B
MLISEELTGAINAQIGREFGASMQYISLATYFDADALPQLAAFFYRQAEEEKMHAMKFVHYLVNAGGRVRIPAIDAARSEFASAEEAVKLALDWEVEVTRQINNLMRIAQQENDYIGQQFLAWFVTEQLEEVSTMDTLLQTVRRAKDNLLWVEDYLSRNPIVPTGPQGGAE